MRQRCYICLEEIAVREGVCPKCKPIADAAGDGEWRRMLITNSSYWRRLEVRQWKIREKVQDVGGVKWSKS